MKKTISLFLLFFMGFLIITGEGSASQISIPFTSQKFQIDGRLNEKFYKDTLPLELVKFPGGGKVNHETLSWISTDGEYLYIAFKCFDSKIERVVAKVKKRDGQLWNDDCVEIFLDTNLDQKTYYHFITNSIGTKYDAFCSLEVYDPIWHGKQLEAYNPAWNAEWEVKTFIDKEFWSVEIAIPLYQFLIKENFGLNLTREGRQLASLVVIEGGTFHQPEKFAKITGLKAKGALAIKNLSELLFWRGKDNLLQAELQNIGSVRDELKVELILKDQQGNQKTFKKLALFQPGEKKKLALVYRFEKEEKFNCYDLSIHKGKKLLYQRKGEISPCFSLIVPGEYFFSGEEIPIFLNCTLLEEFVENLNFEIEIKDKEKIYLIREGKIKNLKPDTGLKLTIPLLSPGRYILAVVLKDGEGNFLDEIEEKIEIVKF
ncbi:MAG: carbohydrate-binding family 9-like protein [Candidatus Ratteibacteria bacterium]